MNYYFLLEDEKSFLKVLPKWLEYIGFPCTRVADIMAVTENNYILQSGKGVTQLVTKVIFDTIETIKNNPGKIDKLVVVLDSEEETEESRKQQVVNKIEEKYIISELPIELNIFVCNRCFESWLLGKENLYPYYVEPESAFFPFYKHYNIEMDDPEKMLVPQDCNETVAKYHFHYLCEVFRYNRIRYSKNNPIAVEQKSYLEGMINRVKKTDHISSFRKFIDFIMEEKEHV